MCCRSAMMGSGQLKAAEFDYAKPRTVDEALAILASHEGEVRPIAGGQSLMPMMNFRLAQPDMLMDLNALEELQGIRDEGGFIIIGAMTRYRELECSELIAAHIPLICAALPHIAHAAIRNRGTIGGSIALADPAAEMPALMLALEATITVVSSRGVRRILADEFFLGLYETALADDEIITEIHVPRSKAPAHFAFCELARRHGDYAIVGIAITAQEIMPMRGLRVALFSVSDRPVRAVAIEQALENTSVGDAGAMKLAVQAIGSMAFQDDLNATDKTKLHLVGVLLKRALTELCT